MRNDDDIVLPPIDFAHDFKVARRDIFLSRERQLRRVHVSAGRRRFAVLPHVMRHALNALERQCRVHRHINRKLAHGELPEQIALQAVAVAIPIPAQRQHLCVDDFDAFLGERFDRKHAGFEDVSGSPLQQSRIAPFAQDSLVDLPSPLLLDDIGLDEFIADPHTEPGDRRIARQRKMEDAFEPPLRAIDERFFDGGACDLIANLDADFVIADGQRFIAAIDIGDERPNLLPDGRPLEPRQPSRRSLEFNELLIAAHAKQESPRLCFLVLKFEI